MKARNILSALVCYGQIQNYEIGIYANDVIVLLCLQQNRAAKAGEEQYEEGY
jgi:hypothetical protein